MTEHQLLYVIAVATGLNALAFVFIAIKGIQLGAKMGELESEVRGHVRQIMATEAEARNHMNEMMREVIPLLQETRGTIGDLREFTNSGRRICENVMTQMVLSRVSPGGGPSRGSLKTALRVGREGIHLLRIWLRRQQKEDVASESTSVPGALDHSEDIVES